MKKIAGIVYLVAFFAVILAGVATMPFIRQDGTAEKRILAEFPTVTDENGSLNLMNFPAGFEDWLDDHIGLRMHWMQQYAELHAALGASVNEQVIVGRDGWLYFEPTLPDYTGVGSLSDNERWRVKYALEVLDRALETPFVVFFVPNKNTVVPEYMPQGYPQAEGVHALSWLIENADVNILDPLEALSAEDLYHKTDTHWNAQGARAGAALLIEEINALTGANGLAADPFAESTKEDYVGDLGQMLFPENPPQDEQFVYADAARNFEYVGRYRTPEDMTITTSGDGAALNVLMLRDSFTNLLIEPISNAYSDVQYRRAMPLPLKDAEEYDVVVLEMVERRIGELLEGTPNLFAPTVQPWEEAEVNCTAQVFASAGKDRVLLYGCLDGAAERLKSLKVAVSAGGEPCYYEAFPSIEGEFAGDGCFSLYLPELPEDAVVQVCMEGDRTLLSEAVPVEYIE